jgi:DivIVA domain-containing protein
MPTNDPRSSPSADVIRRFEFATVRRGYDPDQVRGYLDTVAARIESLEGDLNAAETALESAKQQAAAAVSEPAADQPDPYEAFAKRFAGLLGTADREAERLVDEAKAESTRILDEARMDADRVRVDAQDRAEEARAEGRRALEEARAEAERALSSLAGRRQHLVDQLQSMQARLISAAQDLEVVIEEDPIDLPSPVVEGEAETQVEAEAGAATTETDHPDVAEEAATPALEAEEPFPDPGYEDLWVASEGDAGDLPDLGSIEFDFDEDHAPD